jgi:hypothetical protein
MQNGRAKSPKARPKPRECGSNNRGLGVNFAGKAWASIAGVRLRAADGFVQGVLGFVVIREGRKVPGAGLR